MIVTPSEIIYRSLVTLALFSWFVVQTGASNLVCLVDGVSVPCSQGKIQVCPNARVQVICVNTEANSSNLWRLPQNTCPAKNPPDAMALTQGSSGVPSFCGTDSCTCEAFTAQNNGSDLQTQLCLTSILTFNASSTTSSIHCGSGDVNNNYINPSDVGSVNITTTVAPGPPNLVKLVNGGNDTSLTGTWVPPTTGDAPTSYNVSINDSIGTSWIMPHDGSPSYIHTFAGLTHNKLYSVTVVAINCAGRSSKVTVYNYTLAEPPVNVTACADPKQGVNAPLANIMWSSVAGVLAYAYCANDNGVCNPTKYSECSEVSCSDILNTEFTKDYNACVASYNTGKTLGLPKCQSISYQARCSSSAVFPLQGCLFMSIIFALVCLLF